MQSAETCAHGIHTCVTTTELCKIFRTKHIHSVYMKTTYVYMCSVHQVFNTYTEVDMETATTQHERYSRSCGVVSYQVQLVPVPWLPVAKEPAAHQTHGGRQQADSRQQQQWQPHTHRKDASHRAAPPTVDRFFNARLLHTTKSLRKPTDSSKNSSQRCIYYCTYLRN